MTHRDFVRRCINNDRDRTFIANLLAYRDQPSRRQRLWLADIVRRLGGQNNSQANPRRPRP